MSKFSKGFFLLASSAALCLSGCSDDSPWSGSDSTGGIHLNLETDGRIMKHSTKADDTMSPVVPDGNAFAISLNHVDGSYSKSWTNIEAFNNEESFPIGDYKINASYGDISREGFALPCFMAEEDVHVAPGDNTEVSMVATLANSMVSIRYNDDFINNFPHYSAAVQTPGNDWVVFGQNESRPAYVDPSADGNTKVSITMFNKKNEKVTVEPAKFKILPRRHYIVTINAVGNVSQGNMTLQVEFEEDVVSESVEISLSDELFTAPAPEIKPKNFTVGQPLTFIANEELNCDPQFDILAFAGFEEVTMNVVGPDSYNPIFGKSVEFLSADDITRKNMENVGVIVSGLYPVSGLMAVINIKKYLEQVPPGDYKITLQAKDKLTRLSDPVVLTAKVNPLIMDVSLAQDVKYRANEIQIIVASNSLHFANNLVFDLTDANGNAINAEVTSISDTTVDGYACAKKCILSTDPVVTTEINAKVSCGRMDQTLFIDVVDPDYDVEVDAFAKYVVFRVSAPYDPDLENDLVAHLGIYNGDDRVDESRIIRNTEKNLIIIKTPESAGNTFNTIKTKLGLFVKNIPAFTLETVVQLPNSAFETKGRNIKFDNIQVGGKYNVTVIGISQDYTNTSSINRFEPSGWSTVNDETAYANSNPKNTWFVVPSTYMDNGAVVIRSVGYNHNGTVPPTSGGNMNSNYYCENSPSQNDLLKKAGELFLGTAQNKGIGFDSRPSSLSFDYKYTTAGERGQVDIVVYDEDNKVIANNTEYLDLTVGDEFVRKTVNLPSYPFGKKAKKIFVSFRSTREGVTPGIVIPTGSELNDGIINFRGNRTVAENAYKSVAVGSELTIDNVSLGYDVITDNFNASRRKGKR